MPLLGYLLHPPNFNFVLRQLPAAPFGAMSLANPVLGCIGVARIWTVAVWVHHAVPFGTDHLIVFRPCFHLASEHGRHCWGILIGQNRAQRPNLGFHVGVLLVGSIFVGWLESWVFRIHVGRSRCPHIRPRPRRLECPSRAMITWSWTAIPSSPQTSTTCLDMSISERDGVASPGGGLCTSTQPVACSSIARRRTSRG